MTITDRKRSLRASLLALTLAGASVTLVAPLPALAQTTGSTTVTAADEATESQLDKSVEQVFAEYGIEAEVQNLSLSQLAAIHDIVSGGGDVKQRIENVIKQ